MSDYHLPILSSPDFGVFRAPGPGLGNLLFPISRAVIGAHMSGGKVVFPTMRQIKVGTFLRGERDKRTYGNLLRARTAPEWRDWIAAWALPKQTENEHSSASVTVYEGVGDQFHSLLGHSTLIKNYIKSIAANNFAHEGDDYDIAMHVRRGDFSVSTGIGSSLQNHRTPLSWYLEALDAAVSLLGSRSYRGVLFTDEDPELLLKQLKLKHFMAEPSYYNSALNTLEHMSRAKVLITSQSTFSLWAQYLGESVAIWNSNFDLQRYKLPQSYVDHFV